MHVVNKGSTLYVEGVLDTGTSIPRPSKSRQTIHVDSVAVRRLNSVQKTQCKLRLVPRSGFQESRHPTTRETKGKQIEGFLCFTSHPDPLVLLLLFARRNGLV
jgi:hypothetical protein